jgi:hypothetical protein
LAEAKAVAAAWEAKGRWHTESGGPSESQVVVEPLTIRPGSILSRTEGIAIQRAVAAFLAEHMESSAPNTQKKYAIIMRKLMEHSAEKGYLVIDQWGPIDVREFRQSW